MRRENLIFLSIFKKQRNIKNEILTRESTAQDDTYDVR